jgi:transcription initiation factor TFIID TATA-box-binding protein
LIDYQIENLIASTDVKTELDLKKISEVLENSEYNPDNFPGVIWRPSSMSSVAIIFKDGRMMCTNVRSVDGVDDIFSSLIRRLEQLGIMSPRATCPNCGAVTDSEDLVCIECGHPLQ